MVYTRSDNTTPRRESRRNTSSRQQRDEGRAGKDSTERTAFPLSARALRLRRRNTIQDETSSDETLSDETPGDLLCHVQTFCGGGDEDDVPMESILEITALDKVMAGTQRLPELLYNWLVEKRGEPRPGKFDQYFDCLNCKRQDRIRVDCVFCNHTVCTLPSCSKLPLPQGQKIRKNVKDYLIAILRSGVHIYIIYLISLHIAKPIKSFYKRSGIYILYIFIFYYSILTIIKI